tara:strand:- start:186 stop:476 length:291 start_codon:yes stop_codon:yes gene_type:complete
MKLGLKIAAMVSILVIPIFAHGEKIHDHQKSKGFATAGSRSEAPKKANQEAECTQEVSDQTSKSTDTHSENPEAVDTCSRDNTQKVHDHRKAKNLP